MKSRSLLAILSIAIGVFCVGTLYGMIDLQLSQMDDAHRKSQPSHINLMLRQDADMHILPKLAAIPGIRGLDTLTPVSVRYRIPGQNDWQTGTLIFRPDSTGQHYDLTTVVEGNWPKDKQVGVEQLTAKATGLKPADKVEFEGANGIVPLPVSGIVRHPFVKPPKFGGQMHFFADPGLVNEFGVKRDSFRELLAQIEPPYRIEKARDLARKLRQELSESQIAVNVTLQQDPEQHWGRPFFSGINQILELMALAALGLACVLIVNTLSAHVSQQCQQIGIMKVLGGGIGVIAAVYLLETLIMAGCAVIIAAPPALAAAHVSSCQLLALFNIECRAMSYSPRSVFYMVAGGLLAPLAAALWPVVRGGSMNLRTALASYGLGSDFGQSRLDRCIETIGALFLSTMNAAALGNLFRRKARLVLTQSVLVIAGVMFLLLMSLIASINLTLDNELARTRYNIRLGFSTDRQKHELQDLLAKSSSAHTVEFWRRLPIEIGSNGRSLRQKGSLGLQMLALPAGSEYYRPLIESGRWLNADDKHANKLVLSAETARLSSIKAGDRVDAVIAGKSDSWEVVGLYRWLAGNNFAVEPVYGPLERVEEILRDDRSASFALIKTALDTIDMESEYMKKLKALFQANHISLDTYSTFATLEQRHFARNQLTPMVATLGGLASLVASVGGVGLAGTLAIGVLQRRREIGVMRAIGAPPGQIFRLFIQEGIFHGLVSWLISVPLAYVAARPVSEALGKTLFGIQLDFEFATVALAYWLAIVLGIAVAAAWLPARSAHRLSVKDALS